MNGRMRRAVVLALAVGATVVVTRATVQAGDRNSQNATASARIFQGIYRASVENLGRPDMTFADIEGASDEPWTPVQVATSKTCSQRCSKSCSTTCTTTRGCSSTCKTYTQGCQSGGTTQPDRTAPAGETGRAVYTGSERSLASGLSIIPRSLQKSFTVADVEMLLTIAGYNVSLDGQQGQDSYAAISDFQQRNGMAVTGIADAELWKKLCSSIAVLASVGE